MPRQSTKVSLVCEQCSQPFTLRASRLKYARGRFCGQVCRKAHTQATTVEQGFRARVGSYSPSGCLLWAGHVCDSGYGTFTIRGNHNHYRAHRVAWELVHGPIPDGQCVLHRCDNRVCVNVDHLFLGDRTDNMDDKMRKHRSSSKLTVDQVRDMRRLHGLGASRTALAARFGISTAQVGLIVRGLAWKYA